MASFGVSCSLASKSDHHGFFFLFISPRFKTFGGRDPHRPAEDVAYSVARFFGKGGSVHNYYMVILVSFFKTRKEVSSVSVCNLNVFILFYVLPAIWCSIMEERILDVLQEDHLSQQAMTMKLRSMSMVSVVTKKITMYVVR